MPLGVLYVVKIRWSETQNPFKMAYDRNYAADNLAE